MYLSLRILYNYVSGRRFLSFLLPFLRVYLAFSAEDCAGDLGVATIHAAGPCHKAIYVQGEKKRGKKNWQLLSTSYQSGVIGNFYTVDFTKQIPSHRANT